MHGGYIFPALGADLPVASAAGGGGAGREHLLSPLLLADALEPDYLEKLQPQPSVRMSPAGGLGSGRFTPAGASPPPGGSSPRGDSPEISSSLSPPMTASDGGLPPLSRATS